MLEPQLGGPWDWETAAKLSCSWSLRLIQWGVGCNLQFPRDPQPWKRPKVAERISFIWDVTDHIFCVSDFFKKIKKFWLSFPMMVSWENIFCVRQNWAMFEFFQFIYRLPWYSQIPSRIHGWEPLTVRKGWLPDPFLD